MKKREAPLTSVRMVIVEAMCTERLRPSILSIVRMPSRIPTKFSG